MSIQQIEDKVKTYWHGLPAVITVKEIKRRSQLPKWQDCPKNHLYVGVIRRKRNDKVIVVKHRLEGIYDLNVITEMLSEKELEYLGLKPKGANICRACGQFSTRIDVNGCCVDCNEAAKTV